MVLVGRVLCGDQRAEHELREMRKIKVEVLLQVDDELHCGSQVMRGCIPEKAVANYELRGVIASDGSSLEEGDDRCSV